MHKLGLHTASDLLENLPRSYLDYSKITPVLSLQNGTHACVRVRICGEPRFFRASGLSVISVQAADETGKITLKWFNQPYRRQQIHAGETVFASGLVSIKKGVSLINPALTEALPGILPVYPLTKGLNQRVMREAVKAVLASCGKDGYLNETLPAGLRMKYDLCQRQMAVEQAHFPSDAETLRAALRRLQFENLLYYLSAVEMEKQEHARVNGILFRTGQTLERFIKLLPFAPTNAQRRAMEEIRRDMGQRSPMNRLVQGDVGSGKTVVAMYALFVAVENGYQGALLAPTEIVARQHYEQAKAFFGEKALLLTGGMPSGEKREALLRIASGEATCIVGTHALLQPGVRFARLGVVVTDEQHRFGVEQRAMLQEKGVRPDVLVMSATPIPRTLALLAFADLDISLIDELPPGRLPVKTRIISREKREDMYAYIARQAGESMQAYVVCPLIEESESLEAPSAESVYRELKKKLPDTRVLLLHGRQSEEKKQAVIDAFRREEGDILVSTTVIEVGVHVENACFMVIEGADRFGLSQLHQLRGRVGRSNRQAYCFFLTENDGESVQQRLRILCDSTDGFVIAEKDLALRGPGDFLGYRQHGAGDASPLTGTFDMALLHEVKEAVTELMNVPNDENNRLMQSAVSRYRDSLDHIAMN